MFGGIDSQRDFQDLAVWTPAAPAVPARETASGAGLAAAAAQGSAPAHAAELPAEAIA